MVLALLSLVSLTGCSGKPSENATSATSAEGGEAPAILVLDLTQGERIVDVIHGAHDASYAGALYHLGTHDGDRLFIGGQRSNTFDTIESPAFLGSSPRAFARTRSGELTGFLAWNGTAFAESALYESIGTAVVLEESIGAFAFMARKGEQSFVVRYDGQAFTEVAQAQAVYSLEASPDGKSAVYVMNKDGEVLWGIDARHYTASPDWYHMGGQRYAVTGTTKAGAEVIIEQKIVASHDEFGPVVHDEERSLLAWSARNGAGWSIQSASLADGAAPLAKAEGFSGAATSLRIHAASGLLEAVVPSAEGERFVVGAAGNTLSASGGFENVFLADIDYKATPLAFGVTAKLTSVLVGTKASPQWTEVESLVSTHNGDNFLYVAADAAGVRAVDANKTHTVFAELGKFTRTERDAPVYVGTKADGQVVVLDGQDGPAVVSVEYVFPRSGDSIAWLANVSGGMAVGRELTLGETYAKINGVNLTEGGVLWYDGVRGDKWHRVLEDKASAGYTNLGPVTETSSTGKLAWVGRDVTTTGERASLVATVRDSVIIDTAPITQLDFTASGKDAMQIAQGKDSIPRPLAVPGSDSVYYAGRKDNGVAVGMDAQVHGPFDEVKNLILTPDASNIAFLARKGTWAAQIGAERHTELTDASYLRFTPNGKEIRYEGMRDKTRVTFVGKDEFLEVKAESINENKDVYAFAGLKADGWHVSVSEPDSATRTTSAAFAAVTALRFTPDWFGVDAVVADASGAHVFRKHLGAAPELLAGWADAGLPEYRHLAQAELPMTAWSGSDRIAAEGFGGKQPASLFVAIKRGDWTVRTLRVKAVDETGITIEGALPSEYTEPESGYTTQIFTYEAPFTYYAMSGKTPGEVYRETFYRRVEDKGYTTHRRWLALARGEAVDSVILGDRVVKTEGAITDVRQHPDAEADLRDSVAFAVYRPSDKQSGWTVLDGEAREEQLGWVDRIGDADWTDLSAKGEHTLEWKGYHATKPFHAVGKERYDSVRSVTVAPATGSLGYIGRRAHKEAVWVSGTHGTWFSKVRELTFQGPTDTPVYIGDHVYGYSETVAKRSDVPSEQDTVLAEDRRLSAVVHGDKQTGWRDMIVSVVPADTLEATVYIGWQDGTAALYTGDVPDAQRWESITHFVRTIDEAGATHTHFLGRDAQGWVEVHDGQLGTRVDALRKERLTKVLPASLSPVPPFVGLDPDPSVLVDDQGRYDYVGIVGDQEVFVHQGKPSGAVREIVSVDYYADGATVAVIAKEGNHKRLVVNEVASEPYADIGRPVFCEATNEVHALAVPILPPAVQDIVDEYDSVYDGAPPEEVLRAMAKSQDIEWDGVRTVLLRNAQEVARAWSIEGLSAEGKGTVARLRTDDTMRMYYNGALSEPFDSILEQPGVFLETLEASRYVVTRDDRTFVAGKDVVQPAFDGVSMLRRTRLADVEATVWTGGTGRVQRVVMDDKEVLLAERISAVRQYGKWLHTEGIDGNLPFTQIGDERFDRYGVVESATTPVGDASYIPLAVSRDEMRWLRDGDRSSTPAWAIWDVRGTFTPTPSAPAADAAPVADGAPAEAAAAAEGAAVPEGAVPPAVGAIDAPAVPDAVTGTLVWEWLEGTLDRSAGTLTVRPARLEFVVGADTRPVVLADLPDVANEPEEGAPEGDGPGLDVPLLFTREAQLSIEARREIVKVVTDAIGRPDTKIRVLPVGEASTYADRRLGMQRREAVVSFLQSRGFEAARIVPERGDGLEVRIEVVEAPRVVAPPPRPRRAPRPRNYWDW